jgi:hypothetical protein
VFVAEDPVRANFNLSEPIVPLLMVSMNGLNPSALAGIPDELAL